MRKQMLKSMMIIGVAGFFAGTLNAEETIKLKTSKEIPASIFGTQTHFGQWWNYKKVLPLVEKAGIKWIRDDFGWQNIEMEKGVLSLDDPEAAKKLLKTNAYFKKADNYVNDANVRGIDVIMVLVYGNKHYPYENFEEFKKGYANYCAFAAKHFKGKVKVWEIWNEPTNFAIRGAYGGSWNAIEETQGKKCLWLRRYTDLVIAAAKAIRKVDPDATIIAGSCVFPINYHFMDLLKAKGEAKILDGMVIHPYTYKLPPEVSPYGGDVIAKRDGMSVCDDSDENIYTYSSIIKNTKAKMKAVGMKNTDIYATEFGFSTYHRTLGSVAADLGDHIFEGFSEAAQAKYLARFFILHLVNGIKVAIQYDFQDDGNSPKHMEHNFGMVKLPSSNYEPKPSYYAVQRICALLSDPVKQFKPDWQIAVRPDRYLTSKNWKYVEPHMVWDGQTIQSLNRVEKYLFKNSKTGEVMLVLWNAVRSSDRQDLLSDVTLNTADYTGFSGVDIMTGKSFNVNASTEAGKTVFKNVKIPDYPIVIKMFGKK